MTNGQTGRVSVREARREDLPALVALLQQMSLDAPREEPGPPLPSEYARAFADIDADPRTRLLVAEVDGRVLGTASFALFPSLSYRGRPHAVIENVVVDAPSRGKGIGEALIARCLDLAREAGCARLSLVTDKRRTDAHRFYERLGFTPSHLGYIYRF